MARVVAQATVQVARLTDIMEDEHATRDGSFAITNRRCSTFDVKFIPVAAYKQGGPNRFNGPVAPNRHGKRIFQWLTGFFVKTAKDLIDRAPAGIVDLPARQFLGHRIDVFNVALGVGGDDSVAD